MNKKNLLFILLIATVVFLAVAFWYYKEKDYLEIMVITGATPIAVNADAGRCINLEVSGMTKKKYVFSGDALNALARIYVRTREVSPSGEFLGTYRYHGVPVLSILEGVAPEKPKSAAFDRPLDMVVEFVARDGKKAAFSYGELTMADDSHPVVLAYKRKELKPSKEKNYSLNRYRDDVAGLRLVCPAEPDTARYLDDVVRIVLREPAGTPERDFINIKKREKCQSASIKGIWKGKTRKIDFTGAARDSVKNWVRYGHGKGFKSISDAGGYNLLSVLKKNFPGCGPNDFYLFVACDGYRVLFSGRELFLTEAGKKAMILDSLEGKKPNGGYTLAPVRDYYVDRDCWGLSYIAVLDKI